MAEVKVDIQSYRRVGTVRPYGIVHAHNARVHAKKLISNFRGM